MFWFLHFLSFALHTFTRVVSAAAALKFNTTELHCKDSESERCRFAVPCCPGGVGGAQCGSQDCVAVSDSEYVCEGHWMKLNCPLTCGLCSRPTAEELSNSVLEALKQLARPGAKEDVSHFESLLEMLEALSEEAPGLIALVHLFGIPAGNNFITSDIGKSMAVITRNITLATHKLTQMRKRGSQNEILRGHAFALAGFLLAIGELGMTAATRASFTNGALQLEFVPSAIDGVLSPTKGHQSFEEGEFSEGAKQADTPVLSYFVAAQSQDVVGALAFAFYTMHGLSQRSHILPTSDGLVMPGPSVARQPLPKEEVEKEEDAAVGRCRDAVNLLWSHAIRSAQVDDLADGALARTTYFRVPLHGTVGVTRPVQHIDSKEHADWVKNEAFFKASGDGAHEWGRMVYEGHYESGVLPNVSQAEAAWEDAAKKGHGKSAFTIVMLHTREGMQPTAELSQHMDTVLGASDVPESAKSFTRFLRYKLGVGVAVDPSQASHWLRKAAAQGDVNAMMQLAEAYGGGSRGKDNFTVVDDNGQILEENNTKAILLLRQAADVGVMGARFNIAAHLMRSLPYPDETTSAKQRCLEAFGHVHEIILRRHPLITAYHALARRAFLVGDLVGSLLWYSFLSELGAPEASWNAIELWTAQAEQPSRFPLAVPCRDNTSHLPVDPHRCALFHLRRLAALGDVQAMHKVASSERSLGNRQVAYSWLDRAANRGDPRGRFERAMMQLDGVAPTDANNTVAMEDLWQLWKGKDRGASAAAFLVICRVMFREALLANLSITTSSVAVASGTTACALILAWLMLISARAHSSEAKIKQLGECSTAKENLEQDCDSERELPPGLDTVEVRQSLEETSLMSVAASIIAGSHEKLHEEHEAQE